MTRSEKQLRQIAAMAKMLKLHGRKVPLDTLPDPFVYPPDTEQFHRAFAEVRRQFPYLSDELRYIGYAEGEHYFQDGYDPLCYVVPNA